MSAHVPQIPIELNPPAGAAKPFVHEVDCDECGKCNRDNRVMRADLEAFTGKVLEAAGVGAGEARLTAQVLVAADLRGIPSHGVARLSRYLQGIQAGFIKPGVEPEVVEPAPAIGVIDARHGLGQVVSERAMDLAIAKARANGLGVVTVSNSNHYGIAGYYVLKALAARMIGISLTNSAPLVIPTHGARAMLGTNPIAFGAPAATRVPFLLDMATAVVPRGKLEVYDRNRKQMPEGWAVDEKGYDCQNAGRVLRNLVERLGGGILPLGGRGEQFSGYKGYGLSLMVDILSGVLSGSAFGTDVDDVHRPRAPGEPAYPRVGHFFLALDVGRFMPIEAFERRMDELLDQLKLSPKALDQAEIFVHGEKEFRRAEENERQGIPLADNVYQALAKIGAERNLAPPRCKLWALKPKDDPT